MNLDIILPHTGIRSLSQCDKPPTRYFSYKEYSPTESLQKEDKPKKDSYAEEINEEIEEKRQLSWENFKTLKRFNQRIQEKDIFDIETFICFLKDSMVQNIKSL